MSGSVSGRVFPLCHLRLQVLKQIEERLQANRKAAAEAGRGERMANDSRCLVFFSVHQVLAILLVLLRVVYAGSLQVILFHIHSASAASEA